MTLLYTRTITTDKYHLRNIIRYNERKGYTTTWSNYANGTTYIEVYNNAKSGNKKSN